MIYVSAAAFGGSLVAGLALTPLVRALAHRVGAIAEPAAGRWHRSPTALLGGVAIASAVAVGLLAAFGAASVEGRRAVLAAVGKPVAIGVGIAAIAMFVVGLIDDRVNLRPQTKFVSQVLAGTVLVVFGIVVPLTPWFVANVAVTVFWFVAITNAFNLLDNMDGVAAGVGAVAALFLAVLSARSEAWLHACTSLALAGASLGFLRFNFHPATIFMGDAGSLFIGASLAGILVSLPASPSSNLVSVVVIPLTIVAVPILDTGLVSVTRTLLGRSIAQGGRDHSTHRLALLGLSERQVALSLYAVTGVCGMVGLALLTLDRGLGLLLGTAFLTALALGAGYIARFRVGYADAPLGPKRAARFLVHLVYRRRLAEVLLDVVLVMLAWYGAFRLRFDSVLPPDYARTFAMTVGLVIAVKIAVFLLVGVYRGTWRYSGILDLNRVVGGVLVSSLVVFVAGTAYSDALSQSHSIIYIDALLTAALLLSARLSFRSLDTLKRALITRGERVLIYGAGDAGELALRELLNNPDLALAPVGFVDDDPQLAGTSIHGIPVVGSGDGLPELVERHGVRKILIATRKLTAERRRSVTEFAVDSSIELLEAEFEFKPLSPDRGAALSGVPPADVSDVTAVSVGSRPVSSRP